MVNALPFFNHWYDGEFPPLVGVAVKVTDVEEQIALSASDEVKETEAVLFAFTVTVAVPDKLPAAAEQLASLNDVKVYDVVLLGETDIV